MPKGTCQTGMIVPPPTLVRAGLEGLPAIIRARQWAANSSAAWEVPLPYQPRISNPAELICFRGDTQKDRDLP